MRHFGEYRHRTGRFHLIHSREVHQSFEYFLAHVPSGFHTVILSRGELDPGFENLYAKGQVLKLNARDLSFRMEEASDFFQARGFEFSREELLRIESETEGWAAGLVVTSLTMREEKSGLLPDKMLPSFDRHIGSFLKEQIYSQWPDEVKTFLTYTVVSNRFSASLGQAVTGLENCGKIIENLLKSNSFIIPLDSEGGWRRFPIWTWFCNRSTARE